MSLATFMRDLIDLLIRIDQGMLEFEEPPPSAVVDHIKNAVVSLGIEVLPLLHEKLADPNLKADLANTIEVIDQIRDPSSIPYLIYYHDHLASFMSGTCAIIALQHMRDEAAYVYLSRIITAYAAGNDNVVHAVFEIVVACAALGEWGDPRAVSPLKQAVSIRDISQMPTAAVAALAHYAEGRNFLKDLAETEPELQNMIREALAQTDSAL